MEISVSVVGGGGGGCGSHNYILSGYPLGFHVTVRGLLVKLFDEHINWVVWMINSRIL